MSVDSSRQSRAFISPPHHERIPYGSSDAVNVNELFQSLVPCATQDAAPKLLWTL